MISQVPAKPAGDTEASPALKVRCEPSSPVYHDPPEDAELDLRENNAPFSGLCFPYAGIEATVNALKQVGRCLGGISGEDAVSLRAVALWFRKWILETDNFRRGTDRLISFLSSLRCAVAASSFFSLRIALDKVLSFGSLTSLADS